MPVPIRPSTIYGSQIGPRLKLTPTFSCTSVSSSHGALEASPTPSSSLVKHVTFKPLNGDSPWILVASIEAGT
ncbi:hypothetical protein [Streptomyces mirabilis]|uniref:hypothetical protein n=1 Tax=Streptomyces mirabilis TaxID=68239 RepID=UPI0033A03A0A